MGKELQIECMDGKCNILDISKLDAIPNLNEYLIVEDILYKVVRKILMAKTNRIRITVQRILEQRHRYENEE